MTKGTHDARRWMDFITRRRKLNTDSHNGINRIKVEGATCLFCPQIITIKLCVCLSSLPHFYQTRQTPHHNRNARVRMFGPSLARPSRIDPHRLNGTVHGCKRVRHQSASSKFGNRRSNLDWIHGPRSIVATPLCTQRRPRTIGWRGHSFNK